MTSKERMLTAIEGKVPDRLPVTTHQVMAHFLSEYMGGISNDEFFDVFGLDPILWIVPQRPNEAHGEYFGPPIAASDPCQEHWICRDQWRIEWTDIPHQQYATKRYRFISGGRDLTMVIQANEHTSWLVERPVKEKHDIDLIGTYATAPICDVNAVNQAADKYGRRGLVRGHIPGFCQIFGQPGTWQDAACLVGIEKLILAAHDDPKWVHQLLEICQKQKKIFVQSLKGARYDILELGGGDASSTVISPKMFDEFVAPYDAELITLAHDVGQRIVYHTCGGMMPILEKIAAMNPSR